MTPSRAGGHKVLVVGDTVGVPRVLRHLDHGLVCGIVAAGIRPQYHPALRDVAAAVGKPLLIQPRRGSDAYPGFAEATARLAPDLILCDSYSMLIPRDVLSLAPRGAVNVHGALLPRYRGANPIQWMIINDERDAGVTIHHMDESFDSGDVIAQRRVEARFTDTWVDVLERVGAATDALLAEFLPRILDGTAPRTPQDSREARRLRRRAPGDGEIDWRRSVRAIYNLVRALVQPLPGAFYVLEGKQVVIDRYMSVPDVALLKQEMVGGGWRAKDGRSLRVLPRSTQDRIALGLGSGVEAELGSIDYAGRTASLEIAGAGDAATVKAFAAVELGLSDVRTPAGR